MMTKLKIVIILTVILLAIAANLEFTGFVAAPSSVAIIPQAESIMYEGVLMNDTIFHIAFNDNSTWYSYNSSSYIHGGYDPIDGVTENFTISNVGSVIIDALMGSEDFSNGDFIDTNQTNGNFQIYIPDLGWKDVPDNSNDDFDSQKNNMELCVVNDMPIGKNITGFDFRIRSNSSGNYTAQITLTAYNSETVNPCSYAGEYVIP